MEKEEDFYDSKLTEIKQQLHNLKSKDRVDMQVLQRDLLLAEEELKTAQAKRKKDLKDGEAFLRQVSEKTVHYIEECTKYRNNAAKAVFEAAKERVEVVKRAGGEIEKKVNKALEENIRFVLNVAARAPCQQSQVYSRRLIIAS